MLEKETLYTAVPNTRILQRRAAVAEAMMRSERVRYGTPLDDSPVPSMRSTRGVSHQSQAPLGRASLLYYLSTLLQLYRNSYSCSNDYIMSIHTI
eukprot:COSAG05_NODE_459_length_9617_cov_12.484661_2_plen_95_part_00